MTVRRMLAACFALTLLLSFGARPVVADPLDDAARRIAKQLQSPVCSGASVADSPSELAGQMRNVIYARVQAGETDEQVVAYFVERYGDSVLIEPPRRGIGWAVWSLPLVILLGGGALLLTIMRGWLRPRWAPAQTASDRNPSEHRNGTAAGFKPSAASSVERARAELEQFRREA